MVVACHPLGKKVMEIQSIQNKGIGVSKRDKELARVWQALNQLIGELQKREISGEVAEGVNGEVERINAFSGSRKELRKAIRRSESNILRLIYKKLKLVPKNQYQRSWLAMGMGVFGVPLGIAFALLFGEMVYLAAIGLPWGMVIGWVVGNIKDRQAYKEGRQLNVETENDGSM